MVYFRIMSTTTNSTNVFATYGFVGLGLIGGSIAKAIRRAQPDARIIAYNPSADTLRLALSEGVVDAACTAVDESFARCDIVFLCAPVANNAENLALIGPYLREDAVLTDIGSTKSDIRAHVAAYEGGRLLKNFIGGHPMTGSERTRYRNSRAELLENSYYILAPEGWTSEELTHLLAGRSGSSEIDISSGMNSDSFGAWRVPADKILAYYDLVVSLGALPLVVDCELHDYIVAAVSHLPHVIAASLVNLVRDSDTEDALMKSIAAGGFKDITRIASSSPVMWQQICLTNRDNILRLLDAYRESLEKIREEIAASDSGALYEFFDSARSYRDSFVSTPSGPIKPSYDFLVTIADRPGVIAEVAQILAKAGVNIKNLGITHNREYQEGVLRVEVSSEKERTSAQQLLSDRGYDIHEIK